ncbi:hypothetical protein EYF80_007234 [Liparis tanakae]|uniref:Uncharacterized protein n=1 Tax=Liparis tanakae TaxID=230148 RepID=A0A4Z2IWN6_9TELE|nr:hypothetical protein EYF80_007234 [Liparis tanakae]
MTMNKTETRLYRSQKVLPSEELPGESGLDLVGLRSITEKEAIQGWARASAHDNRHLEGAAKADEADDSDAPHVALQAHGLKADHLGGHKLRRAVHHQQRFALL